MATIKSYTDIEQSRKLAEILSLESADMWYDNNGESIAGRPEVRCGSFIGLSSINIPCWTLASLLELLPKRIEIVDNVYEISIYLYGIYYLNVNNGNLCFESKDKDNLVDACVDTIIRLNELNLL